MGDGAVLAAAELFAGLGGLALGVSGAGFAQRLLVDRDRDAAATLRLNAADAGGPGAGWRVEECDIRGRDFSDLAGLDLLAGGPPCQPWSAGGLGAGTRDDRNLLPEFARAVRECAPRAFVVENVAGLLRPAFRPYLRYLLLTLAYPTLAARPGEGWGAHAGRLAAAVGPDTDLRPEGLGEAPGWYARPARPPAGEGDGAMYRVSCRLLNAADYGVAQDRRRVFLVGIRGDQGCRWRFPRPTHAGPARGAGPGTGPGQGELFGGADLAGERAARLAPWRPARLALAGLGEPSPGHEDPLHRTARPARAYKGHAGSPLDRPAKTIKAGVHGLPGGENTLVLDDGTLRHMSLREATRLQDLPDRWALAGSDTSRWRQIGNAVPPALAGALARSLAGALREADPEGDAQGTAATG